MVKRLLNTRLLMLVMLSVAIAVSPPPSVAAKKKTPPARTVKTVKSEQKTNTTSLNEAQRRLKANEKSTGRELDRLNSIRADIERTNRSIESQQSAVDSIDAAIIEINDHIKQLDARLVALREGYAERLHKMQPTVRPLGRWSYILGGKSLSEMYQRVRYLKQFNAWAARRVAEIEKVAAELQQQRALLTGLDSERRSTLARMQVSRSQLTASETRSKEIVAGLKKDNVALQRELNERRERARKLDLELERLIEKSHKPAPAAEPKKPATPPKKTAETKPVPANLPPAAPAKPAPAKPTQPVNTPANAKTAGSFASAQGHMLFPVSGSYRVVKKFGKQKHPDLPNVMIDNPGIDVETTPGATARAVFDGTVSAVFQQPGYHTIVMIRHGDYLTIYGGLASLSVKTGDHVRGGQSLGRVFSDPSDSGRSILHFEVRHERQKLNPLSWVK